mmetsp:Transcript_41002/g.80195  ORF Transcript_41002/g.80195 Transcript_41002/m.80195 type:complete len:189 (+) Transcript_41002:2-568(+)
MLQPGRLARTLAPPSLLIVARIPGTSAATQLSTPAPTRVAHRSFFSHTAAFAAAAPACPPCAFARGGAGRGMSSASAGQPFNPSDFDPQVAAKMVKEGALLLDVRTPAEYADFSVKGSLNISHDELPLRMSEVTAVTGGKMDFPIVVHCRSGVRSGVAKEFLAAQGYECVANCGGLAEAEEMEAIIKL